MSSINAPFLSVSCSGCPSNAHEKSPEPMLHVVTLCNEKRTVGDCFGVVNYPVKNPSQAAHLRLVDAVKLHQLPPVTA